MPTKYWQHNRLNNGEQITPEKLKLWSDYLQDRELDLISKRWVRFEMPLKFTTVNNTTPIEARTYTFQLPYGADVFAVHVAAVGMDDNTYSITAGGETLGTITDPNTDGDSFVEQQFGCNLYIAPNTDFSVTFDVSGAPVTYDAGDVTVTVLLKHDCMEALENALSTWSYQDMDTKSYLDANDVNAMFSAHAANMDLFGATPDTLNAPAAYSSQVICGEWATSYAASSAYYQMPEPAAGWYLDRIDMSWEASANMTFQILDGAGSIYSSGALASTGIGTVDTHTHSGLAEVSSSGPYRLVVVCSGAVRWSCVLHYRAYS